MCSPWTTADHLTFTWAPVPSHSSALLHLLPIFYYSMGYYSDNPARCHGVKDSGWWWWRSAKRGGVRNVLVWALVIGGLQGRRRQLALLLSQVSARSSLPDRAVMEWELPRVQITLTVSGPAPCLAIWKSCTVTLATEGERLFKREHLVISFNPLQLEIGTLLLNCSCYGYQRSYRQPFQGLFLSSHSSLPPFLWEGSVLLLHTKSIFERADKMFFFPPSSVLLDTLQTTHSLSIFYLCTTKALK